VTYNCRGYNDLKIPFIGKLLQQCDFLCLQEHWLRELDMPLLNNINSNNLLYHGCSGWYDIDLLSGRPYGGVVILRSSHINAVNIPYPHFSKCCCAVKVTVGNVSFALINVYLPTDNFSKHIVVDELRDVIDSLETFIYSTDVNYIVLAGDLNVDFDRLNAHTNFVSDFINRVNLMPCSCLTLSNLHVHVLIPFH
jgi:exonuclease III